MRAPESLNGREVLFEIYPIGSLVRVSALDVESLVEVFIQGPANAGETLLKAKALEKLVYVLRKKGIISA